MELNIIGYLLYYIGKHSKRFRKYYYKKSGGKYLWGIFTFCNDERKF